MDKIQRFVRLLKWSLVVLLGIFLIISLPVVRAMVRSSLIIVILAVFGLIAYLYVRKKRK